MTQLLIWLTPLFNRVTHLSRHRILQRTEQRWPTLCHLMFRCLRQVCMSSIPHRTGSSTPNGCSRPFNCLWSLQLEAINCAKLNKPDDSHLPTWFENTESRYQRAGVSTEEDWFNLFRDPLSDERGNAWGMFVSDAVKTHSPYTHVIEAHVNQALWTSCSPFIVRIS